MERAERETIIRIDGYGEVSIYTTERGWMARLEKAGWELEQADKYGSEYKAERGRIGIRLLSELQLTRRRVQGVKTYRDVKSRPTGRENDG